jgi:heme-degrading monooxygenase HmoA
MIAVLFEVRVHAQGRQQYLDIAAALLRELETHDGFLGIERYQSLRDPEKLLSLSYWRDEASIRAWRAYESHRNAQHVGRTQLFEDYRLRIAVVSRDYGKLDREQAPSDSREVHG